MEDKNKKFLEAENAVNLLLDELKNLKDLSEQVGEVKIQSKTIVDAGSRLVERLDVVIKTSESVFDELGNIYPNGLEVIEKKHEELRNMHAKELRYSKVILTLNAVIITLLLILLFIKQ